MTSVHHLQGDAYAVFTRGHRIVVDQPSTGDSGQTPLELFVASIASCAAFYAGRFLARHGVTGHRVDCVYEQAQDGSVSRVALTLHTSRPLADALRSGAVRAMEHCTVVRSIRGGLDVTVGVADAELAPA
ncbi:MAG TPA: OsmC family protein [Candidatus Limnocylindria bacterium]|nr:OsmC family protein [Candidatus Limnocylindria bacterium]